MSWVGPMALVAVACVAVGGVLGGGAASGTRRDASGSRECSCSASRASRC